jgi:hypothetical protein
MKTHIRPYRPEELDQIQVWWKERDEVPPTADMMPADSTFIVEVDGVAAAHISAILTNCKAMAYLENLGSNPALPKAQREAAVSAAVDHGMAFIQQRGYGAAIWFSYKPKVTEIYRKWGTPTLTGVTTFARRF